MRQAIYTFISSQPIVAICIVCMVIIIFYLCRKLYYAKKYPIGSGNLIQAYTIGGYAATKSVLKVQLRGIRFKRKTKKWYDQEGGMSSYHFHPYRYWIEYEIWPKECRKLHVGEIFLSS